MECPYCFTDNAFFDVRESDSTGLATYKCDKCCKLFIRMEDDGSQIPRELKALKDRVRRLEEANGNNDTAKTT